MIGLSFGQSAVKLLPNKHRVLAISQTIHYDQIDILSYTTNNLVSAFDISELAVTESVTEIRLS